MASEYPLHVVTYWIGNTARIAAKHYLQIPDSVYRQAAQNPAHAAQEESQQAAAMRCTLRHGNPPKGHENADFAVSGVKTAMAQSDSLEAGGSERTPLAISKTKISENGGAKSGAPGALPHIIDPELRQVIERWSCLPAVLRTAITKMVKE